MSTTSLSPINALPRDLLKHILGPGKRLMLGLRMRAKLLMLAACLLLPLCLLMFMALSASWQTRQIALLELEGARLVEQTMPLLLETQVHRGLTARVRAGDTQAQAGLAQSRTLLKSKVDTLDAAVATPRSFQIFDLWQPLKARFEGLLTAKGDESAEDAFALHTQAVEATRQFMLFTAERSGLLLDPEATSYHLMDTAVNVLPHLAESTAQLRGLGAMLLARGKAEDSERARLVGLATVLERYLSDLAAKLGALERAGGEVPGSAAKAREALAQFAGETHASFSSSSIAGLAQSHFEMGSRAIEQVAATHREAIDRLVAELSQRVQQQTQNMALMVAAFVTGLLALAYLLSCFIISFQGTLRELHRGAEAIAQGNLAFNMDVRGRDEVADVGRLVEAMSRRLSQLVSEIRNSASLVNLTGQQVSEGSAKLASRTDEQATSLRTSVSAITQLAAAVATNADAAKRLDSLTGRLATQAEDGNTALQETVQAMELLRTASDRVAEVVAVIDDVAFQTSMLSLNAAIEASRAGDAGKGFAVVASEVRQLAQRCAESAEEIRTLIGNTSAQVQLSSEKLASACESLGTVVVGVRDVSVALRSISDTSSEQSAGLQEITQTVGNLDEITRENAALVEQSSTASHSLVDRADKLREAVASMRLRQGSADEALLMVKRAQAHVENSGREAAFADFHKPEAGFIDRDLYVFCFDREGNYVVCGANTANVGEHYAVTPGLDAQFMSNIWKTADAGGGWVAYEVISPLTKAVMPKESYVVALDHNTLLGCGIYRPDTAAQTKPKKRAAAWSKKAEDGQMAVTA